MADAKIVSLRTRPLNVAHLCFEVSGILGGLSVNLGDEIVLANPNPGQFAMFPFDKFYQTLSAMPMPTVPAYPGPVGGHPSPADPSLLLYNVEKIQADTRNSTLAWLRAESVKTALTKAIMARQNAFFAKYANKDLPASYTASGAPMGGIIATMRQYYDPNVDHSKPDTLGKLAQNSQDIWNQIYPQYQNYQAGPVKTGVNTLSSDITSYGYSFSGGNVNRISAEGVTNDIALTEPSAPPPPSDWPPPFWPLSGQPDLPQAPPRVTDQGFLVGFTGNALMNATMDSSMSSQVGSSQDRARQDQTITPSDFGYRVPMIEAAAQYHRAQISLIDQKFAQFMFGQNLPNLEAVFTNELNSIDADVYRLQIAYLNTILMSPIVGTVTGVYKRPGEAVRTGEPVIRVEDSKNVLLEGTLVYPGPIYKGSTLQLTTNLFDSAPSKVVTGTIISARGRSVDDQWEVVVQYPNDGSGAGAPILPLGYHFDYDDTTVSIT